MRNRFPSRVTAALLAALAVPALAQADGALPCNALCRAYLGPYAPAEETLPRLPTPEPPQAAGEPGSDAAPAGAPTPPRRPAQAVAPAPTRVTVVPPRRPNAEIEVPDLASAPAQPALTPDVAPAIGALPEPDPPIDILFPSPDTPLPPVFAERTTGPSPALPLTSGPPAVDTVQPEPVVVPALAPALDATPSVEPEQRSLLE